jgi:hypothetical protein
VQFVVGDDVIMAGLKDVVMHEVGHTLGLRHNFKASSGVTWEQTQDIKYTQVRSPYTFFFLTATAPCPLPHLSSRAFLCL